MYIRIEFKDINSKETIATRQLLFGIPNGMFLSSYNARGFRNSLMDNGNSAAF
jgi:hypothetical protein